MASAIGACVEDLVKYFNYCDLSDGVYRPPLAAGSSPGRMEMVEPGEGKRETL